MSTIKSVLVVFPQNDNPDWTFIYGGVHLENFAVTENLDVLLNNLEDFAIVDKKFFKTGK